MPQGRTWGSPKNRQRCVRAGLFHTQGTGKSRGKSHAESLAVVDFSERETPSNRTQTRAASPFYMHPKAANVGERKAAYCNGGSSAGSHAKHVPSVSCGLRLAVLISN